MPFDSQDRARMAKLNVSIKENAQGEKYVEIKDMLNYINSNYNKLTERNKNLKKSFDHLSERKYIRNQSFIAHTLKWVTKSGAKELYDIVQEILKFYQEWEKKKNVFDLINEHLFKLI